MPITVYSNNVGGMDISTSPIAMADNKATGQSWNYDYTLTGAIQKTLGSAKLNGSADSQLNTLGLGIHHDVSSDVRTVLRAAGTKIQSVNQSTGTCTNLTDDTASAGTNFLSSSSIQPVVFSTFNTIAGGTQTWMAGGGLAALVGYYGSNITTNGVAAPGGSITPTVNSHAGGSWSAAGKYYYAIQFRKRSTQTFSNLSLDVLATTINTDDTVTLPLTSVTGIDTTLYDQIWIWRSALNGVSGFTTGSIIAKLASTATTYTDTGSSIADSQNCARAGNAVLDNSQLPSGTYNYITAFKRRLVAAVNSTIYLSDSNKPESWPTANNITLPTGGPITALATIGVPSEYTTGADEYLVIFKQNEVWVLVGTGPSDWDLKQIDRTGCEGQTLVVACNGYLAWIGVMGIYIWQGNGRPMRVSRPIYTMFNVDGDVNLGQLKYGYSCYYQSKNQIMWRVSHKTKGTQAFTIKLDVRQTIPQIISSNLEDSPEADGVFIFDYDSNPYYGMISYRTSTGSESIYAGDNAGNFYQLLNSNTAVGFDYETKPFDMGQPQVLKRFKRVIVWLEKILECDLTLYFWADYRIRADQQSEVHTSIGPARGSTPALYDVANWDDQYWDDYTQEISQVEFNLHSQENNAEGLSLKLKFEQLQASAPVKIHAFAIEWEPVGNLPIPTSQVA